MGKAGRVGYVNGQGRAFTVGPMLAVAIYMYGDVLHIKVSRHWVLVVDIRYLKSLFTPVPFVLSIPSFPNNV